MTGWTDTFFFLENKTSWAGWCGFGLKIIFQLKAHFAFKERSLLRAFAVSFSSLTIVNIEVSSAKSFALVFNPLGKPLILMRKRSGPKSESWGSPPKIGLHDDVCPFKMTLWNLPDS